MDACGIAKTDYDELKKGWLDCIGKPGAYSVRFDPARLGSTDF